MLSDDIILICHIVLFCGIVFSPLIHECQYKKIILVLILFMIIQFVTKYGKCGLINIEKYFLKDKFKEGFVYRLIKPIICYKINPFGGKYFILLLIYVLILVFQLYKAKCSFSIFPPMIMHK
jgi:hypothetical protein